MSRRLEFYMETYNSTPIVHEDQDQLCISVGDELSKEAWSELLNKQHGSSKVRVTDIRHLFWDEPQYLHTVTIKVVPVD